MTTFLNFAITAADEWIDFEFDIKQFHQSTPIPATATAIITTQPKGFCVRGEHGEPPEEMFWQLLVQMQGTNTASSMANARLDELLIKVGGFKRCLGDSRFFTCRHDVHGGVRLGMLSDDGSGSAQTQGGVDYTLELMKRYYTLSKSGPWTTV